LKLDPLRMQPAQPLLIEFPQLPLPQTVAGSVLVSLQLQAASPAEPLARQGAGLVPPKPLAGPEPMHRSTNQSSSSVESVRRYPTLICSRLSAPRPKNRAPQIPLPELFQHPTGMRFKQFDVHLSCLRGQRTSRRSAN
jgi:hypothetical protein